MQTFRPLYRASLVALWLSASLLPLHAARAADMPSAAPSDKALVYLIQRDTGVFANLLINFDERNVWSARANSFFALLADPGEHEVSTATHAPGRLFFSVSAGETYYVQIQIDANGVPQISELTAAAGADALTRGSTSAGQPAAVAGTAGADARRRAEQSGYSNNARRLALILKGGSLEMTERQQTLDGLMDIEFKDSATGVFGVEAEFDLGGSAWGIEIFGYRNSLTDDSARVEASAVMFNLRKYFGRAGGFRPFLGIGAGAVAAEFEGVLTGSGSGFGGQALAGFEYMADTRPLDFGVFVELKYLAGKAEDDVGAEVDVGATGAFAGLKLAF